MKVKCYLVVGGEVGVNLSVFVKRDEWPLQISNLCPLLLFSFHAELLEGIKNGIIE